MHLDIDTISLNILHKLLTGNLEGVVVKSNTFDTFSLENPTMDDAFMQKLFNEPGFSDNFRASLLKKEQKQEAVIEIDGTDFVFKRAAVYGPISIYRIPKADFSNIASKFNEPITDDVNILSERFKELASTYSSELFYRDSRGDDLSKFTIVGYGMSMPETYFVSEHFIDLCVKVAIEMSQESFKTLNTLIENPMVKIPEINQDLTSVFDSWSKLLIAEKATANKPFIYNDHDNFAYYASNDVCEMMSQRSQNVVYVYVREKASGIIKVFNSVAVATAYLDMADMIEDWISDGLSHIEVMQYIMDSYGAPIYPTDLDNINTYLKSPEYHMNNFDNDDNIIYDSVRGYNTQSKHIGNMISDLDILKMLIADGHF